MEIINRIISIILGFILLIIISPLIIWAIFAETFLMSKAKNW